MTGKLIRVFFISLLLVLNALAYYFYFQPNEPRHLAYIPENSMMVFTINSKEITGKLAYTALFREGDFTGLMEDDTKSDMDWSDNINNGLNFFGRITMLMLPNEHGAPFSCMLLDISSEKQLTSFLEKSGNQAVEIENGIRYADMSATSGIVFNREVAMIFTGNPEPESWKKEGAAVLAHRVPVKQLFDDPEKLHKDFMMDICPAIEKMDQAPALKGMFGSFIKQLQVSGEFSEENIEMYYELMTDTVLVADAGEVFDEHEYQHEIPEELLNGILNVHLTFNPEKWVNWMQKGNLLAVPDSMKMVVYPRLAQSFGHQFVMEVNGVNLVRIELDSSVNGNKTFPLPDFTAAFSLKDSEPVKDLFEELLSDSLLSKEGEIYTFVSPFKISYHFKITEKTLAMTTNKIFIEDPAAYFHGFSNWFYFNAENYISAIPGNNPVGYMVREVMLMVNNIHYSYGYTTGTKNNRLLWEGKMFYNETKTHSLIETIKFMQKMAGLFVF